MKKLNLAGEWKLRGEFIDCTADKFALVSSKLDKKPVGIALPDGVTFDNLPDQAKAYLSEFMSEDFTVYTTRNPNAFPSKNGYITANVPCDVTTALVKNGIIEEPFLKINSKKSLWIKDLSWWFFKDFEITQDILQEDIVRLNIEVLDFNADIILNGIPVGKHTNAFCAFSEDIKPFLKVGTNTLIIRLTSGMELNYPKDSISFYCGSENAICDQRIYTRKPQFSYGWDWCQPVPTCGIGRSIEIEAFTGAKISSSRVDTLNLNTSSAEIEFHFEIEKSCMTSSEDCILEYLLEKDGKLIYKQSKELHLVGGINFFSEKANLDNVKLWWPNGYGEQNLYTFKAKCIIGERTSEMKEKEIGIRTIEIDISKLDDGTRNFFFKVNGVRIFCKGGNWVPTDSIYLRTPAQNYEKLVSEGAKANFTMFRMWGGGTYEPDCFYEYCSKYGILLMHDFMYACAFYPDNDKDFLNEATLEAEFQTKRLAHYPCMAIWTGNNEIAESYTDWFPAPISLDRIYGEKIFNYIQPRAVKNNSPLIPYLPSSPFLGPIANVAEQGDIHAWTYFSRDDKTKFKFMYELEAFDRFPARFSSEYGFFGAQMESTVKRYHQGEELSFDGEIWKHHGEFERKRNSIDEAIQRHLTEFSSLDIPNYLIYSGVMQGLLYLELAEGIRRKSYGSGDLIWMYNDCWPETGWTIIDYYLTRKVSFYFLKRAFATKKLIIRNIDNICKLTVINETNQDINTTINCCYMSFEGKKSSEISLDLTVKAHSWQDMEVSLNGDMEKGFFYACDVANEFESGDSLRAYYRNYTFPVANVEIVKTKQVGEDLQVTVKSDKYVPVTYLKNTDDTLHYSDNFFKLYPMKEKTIVIEKTKEIPQVIALKFTPKN